MPAPIVAAAPASVIIAPTVSAPTAGTHALISLVPGVPVAPVFIDPNAINPIPAGPEDGNWYAITVGRRVGVFNDWCVVTLQTIVSYTYSSYRLAIAPHVREVSGAAFKKYLSRTEASAAFNVVLESGGVVVAP
jgi:hypothetical protein